MNRNAIVTGGVALAPFAGEQVPAKTGCVDGVRPGGDEPGRWPSGFIFPEGVVIDQPDFKGFGRSRVPRRPFLGMGFDSRLRRPALPLSRGGDSD